MGIFSVIQGKLAEGQAARFLKKSGYKILCRNYRSRFGEIDLVAEKGEILVFVEVKKRAENSFGSALDAVTSEKQKKIIKTARHYLSRTPSDEKFIRFDVITVDSHGKCTHIPDAFYPKE